MNDRREAISTASALVDPRTGGALLRALQMMDDSWDYKLPEEGENFEIDHGPYRLIGWLCKPNRDGGIDEKDPLRGYATIIHAHPGRRVLDVFRLARDMAGRPTWSRDIGTAPMFVYEVWGEPEEDNERYFGPGYIAVAGNRLLAHKEQLREFLLAEELDLLIEVGVTRRERNDRRFAGKEERTIPEERFDRLYKLESQGALDVAEGRLGAWTGDRR